MTVERRGGDGRLADREKRRAEMGGGADLERDVLARRASVFHKPIREFMRIVRQIRSLVQWFERKARRREALWETGPAQRAEPPERQADAKAALRMMLATRLEGFLANRAVLQLPSSPRPDVSIILILHNQAELTYGCLTSIAECVNGGGVRAEVIIVDNLSTDRTAELLARTSGAKTIYSQENLHFLRGVNRAASEAKGRYLLLLNNDAQLFPGSIEAALNVFRNEADVGAVGARIILPDGQLQEAGSIVWSDGSCSGYARGYSPTDPSVMFRRDVDYCSGAFLLTPRSLFKRLGGFDEAFAPAYYEETDYCLRLWQAGLRVVYEPAAVILHYEFGSATRLQEVVALQKRNQLTFRERHRAWLTGQLPNLPENVLSARRRRSGAKRLLMIEDRAPHDHLGSGFPRASAMLREFAARAEVTFFPMNLGQERWAEIRRSIAPTVEVMTDQSRETLAAFLRERRGQFDAILVCRPHNMRAFLEAGGGDAAVTGGAPVIYDAEAIFAIRDAQKSACRGSPLSPEMSERLLREELSLARRASQVISVSRTEQRVFESHGITKVQLLSHAFAMDPTEASFDDRCEILFVGAMHAEDCPNADSLRWFAAEVLPRLRVKLGTELRLKVVGLNRAGSIERLDGVAFDLVGSTQNLRPHFETARLMVAPTRYAAGIPHKIGQAAAFGVPVVATELLAGQIGWVAGRDLLAASEPEAFADACATLYHDRCLWERLRNEALERCREAWSPASFRSAVTRILDGVPGPAELQPVGHEGSTRSHN